MALAAAPQRLERFTWIGRGRCANGRLVEKLSVSFCLWQSILGVHVCSHLFVYVFIELIYGSFININHLPDKSYKAAPGQIIHGRGNKTFDWQKKTCFGM